MKAHHIGLYVNNLGQSEQFYRKLFGFEVEYRFTLKDEEISFLSNRDSEIKLELIKANDVKPLEGTMHLAWEVTNLKQSIEHLATNGLNPIEGPLSLHNGWKTAFYHGPNNEVIELMEI